MTLTQEDVGNLIEVVCDHLIARGYDAPSVSATRDPSGMSCSFVVELDPPAGDYREDPQP